MELEIKIKNRVAKVQLLHQKGSLMTFLIDGKSFKVDLEPVAEGIYSLIHQGKSYNIEMVKGSKSKNYLVSTFYNTYDTEVVDAETKYLQSRKSTNALDGENAIFSPMPGKIVKILVETGQEVKAGQTLVIVSAMKMESEYKAGKDAKIKAIHVKEGDLVEGNKILVLLE
jgi:biotin carboxyl carrier protein